MDTLESDTGQQVHPTRRARTHTDDDRRLSATERHLLPRPGKRARLSPPYPGDGDELASPEPATNHNDDANKSGDERAAYNNDCDAFYALPNEILGLLFHGRALDGRFLLDPRWRTIAAMTCRRWRGIIETPSRAAVAMLERVRPPRAPPAAWCRGRLLCASILRDVASTLARDMGAIGAWLRLVPSLDAADVRTGVAMAITASGNATAIRDIRPWGELDPQARVAVDWFANDTPDTVYYDPRGMTVAWATVRAACQSQQPEVSLGWVTGRWGGALSGESSCDWHTLSLDIAATGSPRVLDMVMSCLSAPCRRALWDSMIYSCLCTPSAETTDLLLQRLFEMVDGRDEDMVLCTVEQLVTCDRSARDAHRDRRVAFTPWMGGARRWCLLALASDRPRAAATAIALWGVPARALSKQGLDALVAMESTVRVCGGSPANGTHDQNQLDAYVVDNGGGDVDAENGHDDDGDADEQEEYDENVEGGDHEGPHSELGFWHAAVAYAIANGATASLDWLLADDDHGGAGPLARSVFETTDLMRAALAQTTTLPSVAATRLLVGLRHLAGRIHVEPSSLALVAAALNVCARGSELYVASGAVLSALALSPRLLSVDQHANGIVAAVGGLLRAREWSMLDALVSALDTAPSDMLGDSGDGTDLWMGAALDCRRASVARQTSLAIETHDRSPGLYFLAMRSGALSADTLDAGVIGDHVRHDVLAPDVDVWRRWCRVRPLVIDLTTDQVDRAAVAGGLLHPVDPAWSALRACGLVRCVDAPNDEIPRGCASADQ